MKEKKEVGSVRVTVQREDRLSTINILALAMRDLVRALNTVPQVYIMNNEFHTKDKPSVSVDTADDVEKTTIYMNDADGTGLRVKRGAR